MLNGKMYIDGNNYAFNWAAANRNIKSSSLTRNLIKINENKEDVKNDDRKGNIFNIARKKHNFQLRDQSHSSFMVKEKKRYIEESYSNSNGYGVDESNNTNNYPNNQHNNPSYVKNIKFEIGGRAEKVGRPKERPSTNKLGGSIKFISKQVSATQLLNVNPNNVNNPNNLNNSNNISNFNSDLLIKRNGSEKNFSDVQALNLKNKNIGYFEGDNFFNNGGESSRTRSYNYNMELINNELKRSKIVRDNETIDVIDLTEKKSKENKDNKEFNKEFNKDFIKDFRQQTKKNNVLNISSNNVGSLKSSYILPIVNVANSMAITREIKDTKEVTKVVKPKKVSSSLVLMNSKARPKFSSKEIKIIGSQAKSKETKLITESDNGIDLINVVNNINKKEEEEIQQLEPTKIDKKKTKKNKKKKEKVKIEEIAIKSKISKEIGITKKLSIPVPVTYKKATTIKESNNKNTKNNKNNNKDTKDIKNTKDNSSKKLLSAVITKIENINKLYEKKLNLINQTNNKKNQLQTIIERVNHVNKKSNTLIDYKNLKLKEKNELEEMEKEELSRIWLIKLFSNNDKDDIEFENISSNKSTIKKMKRLECRKMHIEEITKIKENELIKNNKLALALALGKNNINNTNNKKIDNDNDNKIVISKGEESDDETKESKDNLDNFVIKSTDKNRLLTEENKITKNGGENSELDELFRLSANNFVNIMKHSNNNNSNIIGINNNYNNNFKKRAYQFQVPNPNNLPKMQSPIYRNRNPTFRSAATAIVRNRPNNKLNLNTKHQDNYIYTYVVVDSIDKQIMSKVMEQRLNWHESTENKVNFKWKYNSSGLTYNSLCIENYPTEDSYQIVNHFEFHTELTNKRKMFINLLRFCNKYNIDCFGIVPLTIIVNNEKDSLEFNFQSFSDIFNSLDFYKKNQDNCSKIIKKNNKGIYFKVKYLEENFYSYSNLFIVSVLENEFYENLKIYIPYTHFINNNLWIVKPTDLCQGKCLEVLDDLKKIYKKVKQFFNGIEVGIIEEELIPIIKDKIVNSEIKSNKDNDNKLIVDKIEKDLGIKNEDGEVKEEKGVENIGSLDQNNVSNKTNTCINNDNKEHSNDEEHTSNINIIKDELIISENKKDYLNVKANNKELIEEDIKEEQENYNNLNNNNFNYNAEYVNTFNQRSNKELIKITKKILSNLNSINNKTENKDDNINNTNNANNTNNINIKIIKKPPIESNSNTSNTSNTNNSNNSNNSNSAKLKSDKKIIDNTDKDIKKSKNSSNNLYNPIKKREKASTSKDIKDLKYIKKESSSPKPINDNNDINAINDITPKQKKKKYFSNSIIIQKYIENPCLYKNRKFDIRVWVLITHEYKVFMFKEGHIKTSSHEYDISSKNSFIHITNYSLQKYSSEFSKHELGNEASYSDLNEDLLSQDPNHNFYLSVIPKMKRIIEITSKSVRESINRKNAKFCFELLGYDFILDNHLNPWLLEINDSPGLCESSPLIGVLVPRMLDDAFRLTIDTIFQTQYSFNRFTCDNTYISPFKIDGYSNEENLWDYICTLYKGSNQEYDNIENKI